VNVLVAICTKTLPLSEESRATKIDPKVGEVRVNTELPSVPERLYLLRLARDVLPCVWT